VNVSVGRISVYAFVLLATFANGCSMSASSSSFPLNQNSSITFTLTASESKYIPIGETLYSPKQLSVAFDKVKEAEISTVDIDGNVTGLLVVANDNGDIPDVNAGDGIYTARYVFNESQNAMIRLRGQFDTVPVEITAGVLPTLSDLKSIGSGVYTSSKCYTCHGLSGMGVGAFPALAGSPITTGYPIADNLNIVMNGSSTNYQMMAFDGVLNDDQLAAVITYIRNAFGNNTGDVIYASDIRAYRNAQ